MIIGITGKINAGKSTVSNILVEKFKFVRIKFSSPLKQMIQVLGLSPEQLEERSKELPLDWLGNVTPRRLMQTLGTEWGRNLIHPDLWCMIMGKKLDVYHSGNIEPNLVCDDLRFLNEIDTLSHFPHFHMWEIQRPGLSVSTHASENQLHGIEPLVQIMNSGTLEELELSVIEAHKTTEYLSK